ncbi:hypothetical protein JKF63_07773 [Porcisia hertigi]|uniref:Uncharacterized protein n=1 Tax=Porcisia hertigi TaxID=2761500 RepID=A0A836LLV2_9TRYP|nr:hypothetical protein JKF63_07773 [Porcisia hertigi]
MSVLARLQLVVTKGSDAAVNNAEISEMQLLWSAIESSTSVATAGAASSQAPTSPATVADASSDGLHARFIAETTGLLWGGDYPPWMVQQWVRLSDDEEEGDGDEAVVVAESGCDGATGISNAEAADKRAFVGEEARGAHAEGRADSPPCGHGTSPLDPWTSPCSAPTKSGEAAGALVSDSDTPVQAPSLSWTRMMQQALESLQLHLPLHQGSHTPQPPLASSAEVPVTTLAKHLVQDAPLLWLRYLLVPMYRQWSQQRTIASPAAGRTAATTTSMPPSSSSPSIAAALERDGSATMHKLLGALGMASMGEALQNEQSWSDDLVELVAAGVATPPSAAAETLKALHSRQAALEDQQRRHMGDILYFTGTLAKAAQSFMVLGQGGYTIIAALIVRLLGRAKAAWTEWASRLTEADVQRVAGVLHSNGVQSVEEPPAEKRVRVELPRRCGASPSGTAHTEVLGSFAALRAAVSAVARRQAYLVWRCWYTLYAYYGTDLYTNEVLARALEEEDLEKAGVRRMTAAQQAHWRRLRLAADVKQHALSETHWLWCSTLLASIETTLVAALREKSASRQAQVETCANRSTMATAEASSTWATELLYLRLLEGTLQVFIAELRNALRVYGEAALALRSGGLPSSTLTMPSVLQSVAHNTMALQDAFAQCLVESLRQTPATAMSSLQLVPWAALRTQAGAYLWHLYTTLLRVQVPEEASWMSTVGAEQAGDAVGVSDVTEVATGLFAEQFQRYCRRRGRLLSAAFSDCAHCMEQTLAHRRCCAASSSPLPPTSDVAPLTAAASASNCSGCSVGARDDIVGGGESEEGNTMAGFLSDIVHSPANGAAALCDVTTNFYAMYDQSCFFVLRPERQRLFTHSVQRLYRLLMSPSDGHPDGSSSARSAAGSAATMTTPPGRNPLVCVVRRDTRLWMLLAHGVLLQLERRGRMAREDEALLTSYLLPLMVLLGSRQNDGEVRRCSTDQPLPCTVPEASPAWTDLATAKDVLLLLASGLVSLPWGLEELYTTVQRHTALCLRHWTRRDERLSDDDTAAAVTEMAAWFGATELAHPSTALSSPTTAVASPWDLSGAAEAGSPQARRDGGAAALSRERARIDMQYRQDDPLFQCGGDEATPASAEARLTAALARHSRLASASLASAPCGLLMVVGAYRSCGRALHSLRAALEEQRRVAGEVDGTEFVGRTITFCTSADISTFRGLVTTVHSCVFGCACQTRGLLQLWMGYLQHLFECVVPRSVSQSSGDATGNGSEDTLVLMPSSWQQRKKVTTLFGARVYQTGWRALQHDGEPASQTRLREVLGECLANLMLLPYSYSHDGTNGSTLPAMGTEDNEEIAATRSILQRTLPHMVLEILCELLGIPIEGDQGGITTKGGDATAMGTPDKSINESFLGLAGLLAFLRQLELLVVPGSLQDCRLVYVLRRVYEAADAAALGI